MNKEQIKSEAEKSWNDFVKRNAVTKLNLSKATINSLKKTFKLGFIKGANWGVKLSQSPRKV